MPDFFDNFIDRQFTAVAIVSVREFRGRIRARSPAVGKRQRLWPRRLVIFQALVDHAPNIGLHRTQHIRCSKTHRLADRGHCVEQAHEGDL